MALQVIGVGFGRTGTHALKHALEMIGFGPCYHMVELMQHPEYVSQWQAAVDGEAIDWDMVFRDYRATVDWPAVYFWRDLIAHFPEAKVLLTVRDAERWYESFYDTIYTVLTAPLPDNQAVRPRLIMNRKLILEMTFGGRFEDRAHAIGVYERHNAEVQHSVPAERLLVYEVAQGWEPLCAFLESPVPDVPFPRTNDRDEFQARIAAQRAASGAAPQADKG